jgi:hypothetical protein
MAATSEAARGLAEMNFFTRDLTTHLSYYIKPEGDVTAVMPDQDATFTLKFIQDFLGLDVEVACYTSDGFALVRNSKAEGRGLPINNVASSVLSEAQGQPGVIYGRAFLIHPDHFDRRLIPAA